jgi:exodeoxyribonuclease VII large subunit
VIQALNRINESADEFDVVVIIRGGGATSDMSGFDTLLLAENVANFPLPIITGIGHERDESIIDMISHTRVKTPTAAASFLIDCMKTQLDHLEESQDTIAQYVSQRMQQAQLHLQLLTARIPIAAHQTLNSQHQLLQKQQAAITTAAPRILERHRQHLAIITSALKPQTERRLEQEQHRLELLAQRTHALDPVLLLNRGYSITLKDGHAVTNATTLHPGDTLETRLARGIVMSTVTNASSKQR